MKVIKHGKAYRSPNAKFVTECQICGCQFEYADEEVKFQCAKKESFNVIYCPECHMPIPVDDRWNKEIQNER